MKIKEKWPHLLLAALILGFCIYEVFWGGQGADWWVGADYGQDQEQAEASEHFEAMRAAALEGQSLYQQVMAGETVSVLNGDDKESKNVTEGAFKKESGDGQGAGDASESAGKADAGKGGEKTVEAGAAGAEAGGSETATGKHGAAGQKSDSLTCTLTVSCATVLNNMDSLNADKTELIPKDGIIYPTATVSFKAGETVFDVLKREMKDDGIHMEFVDTPGYSTSYIEGLANLYEFDCGPLSGWMYQVNGEFINYGCSLYELKDGDEINWVYTCDLGKDVGNTSFGG